MSAPAQRRPGARELIDLVLDPGSFTSWDAPVGSSATDRPSDRHGADEVSSAYAADLAAAAQRAGTDESVLTGSGTLHRRRVAVVVSEFAFLAGSIGVAAAARITAAVERATAERLPLLAAPASGGTRMQEGTVAFVTMVAISAAVAAHRAAGLPYLVHLRHPTAGGVFASWGSLGHLTTAEPGALIGFLGPRVYEALHGRPFPPGVQVAENLVRRGLLDAVVSTPRLRDVAARALDALDGSALDGSALEASALESSDGAGVRDDDVLDPAHLPDTDAWESVRRSRDPRRPGVREVLRWAADDVLPLQGTGAGESDPGLLLALVRLGGVRCVLLGQDRLAQEGAGPLGPAALRTARRGMALARELHLPLVTVVDTPGAALSVEAEQGGLAGEIARCLAEMVTLDVATTAVLLGQGTGGGALALLPADRVVAAQHAWLAPLPPEGASAIVHRDTGHAAAMAAAHGVRSVDLARAGLVDVIVAERPDAADEPEAFCRRLGRVVEAVVHEAVHEAVQAQHRAGRTHGPAGRTAARTARYRFPSAPAGAPPHGGRP